MVLCPKCNTVNSDNEKYCKNCGFLLNASRICPQCGKVNHHNSKYCDECGATLSPVNSFKRDVIAEEKNSSFFSKYRTALIAALILVLAVGAVTGITLYSGNDDGGDNEPFFPLVSGNNSQNDDNVLNGTDSNDNLTGDNKTAEAKNLNESNKSAKQLNDKNKTDKADFTQSNKSANVNNKNRTDKTDPAKNANQSQVKDDNQTKKADNNDKQINMNTKTVNSNKTSDFKIKLTDVPNLAKEVADSNYKFTSLDYNGHSYSESQCIYIFCDYILKIDEGDDSSISVRSVNEASNPNGEDKSQKIKRSDYLSMAKRIVSFIDNNNAVPNYVGISGAGSRDLSPDKLLNLYTQIVLNYAVSGDLPESVEI